MRIILRSIITIQGLNQGRLDQGELDQEGLVQEGLDQGE